MRETARTTLALALGSLVLYSVNFREISAQDTVGTRLQAYELTQVGRLDLDRSYREWPAARPLPYFVQRVGAHYYSSYPLMPALLAAPVYLTARLAGVRGGWTVVTLLAKLAAAVLAALSVVFVYLAARALATRLGAGEGSALAAALVYAAATPTWAVSSQGLWGHAPAQLGLAVALWALVRAEAGAAPLRDFTLAGLGLGVMAMSRPSTVLVAAVLAIPGLRQWRQGGLALLGSLGVLGAAAAAYNWRTFGSLQGGYAELQRTHEQFHGVGGPWSAIPLGGLPGILVSPSRGLFVYAPILLFAVAGLVAGARARRAGVLGYAGAAVAVGVATIAQFSVWWGGHSFGPRLLTDLLPALALGLVPVWAPAWRSPVWRGPLAAALVVSVLVEAVGAFCYPSPRAVEWNATPVDVDHAHERLWDWRDSQLLRLLRNGPVPPGVP